MVVEKAFTIESSTNKLTKKCYCYETIVGSVIEWFKRRAHD